MVLGYPVIVPRHPARTPHHDNLPLLLRICHRLLVRYGHGCTMRKCCNMEGVLYAYARQRTIPLPALQPPALAGTVRR
jgi:hypothetical protein